MKKGKNSKLGLFLLIGVLIYFGYVMAGQQKLLYEKNTQLNTLQEKIKKESELNEELKQEKDMVNSDKYVEKVAREKLDMVKHGERVFVDVNK